MKLSFGEAVAVGGLGCIIILILLALFLALGVGFWGCIAMAVTTYILPLFDINYDLTWTQAFGIGFLVCIVIWILRSAVGVTVQSS